MATDMGIGLNKGLLGGLLAATVVLGACAPEGNNGAAAPTVPDQALAVVDGEAVDGGALRAYVTSLQEAHRSKKQGYEAHHEHLLSLIDSKLLALEAADRGYGEHPDLLQKTDIARRKATIETYLAEVVGRDMTVSEAELEETFRNNPGHQSVLAAHILVGTRREADSLYALIQEGADFADLARRHSLDRDTAENGGKFDKYYEFSRVSYNVFRHVFDSEVGEVIEPFRKADGWEIVKVVDRKEVDLDKYRPQVFDTAMRTKFLARRNVHLDSLAMHYNVVRDDGLYGRFVEAWNKAPGKPEMSADELAAPLYTFDGGTISVQQVVYVLHNTSKGSAKISGETLHPHLLRFALGDQLFLMAAAAAGFDDHERILAAVEEERHRQLLALLWEEELEEALTVTEEEAKAHFSANPEYYMRPAEVVVQEVLLESRDEALEVMQALREGAEMGPVASQRSIRKLAEESSGVYGIRSFEGVLYKNLLDAAQAAPLDELQGPLEILEPPPSTLNLPKEETPDRVYSVFKVLERSEKQPMDYENPETTRRSFFFARQQKQQERLVSFAAELRQKYRARWALSEENLKRYAEAGG